MVHGPLGKNFELEQLQVWIMALDEPWIAAHRYQRRCAESRDSNSFEVDFVAFYRMALIGDDLHVLGHFTGSAAANRLGINGRGKTTTSFWNRGTVWLYSATTAVDAVTFWNIRWLHIAGDPVSGCTHSHWVWSEEWPSPKMNGIWSFWAENAMWNERDGWDCAQWKPSMFVICTLELFESVHSSVHRMDTFLQLQWAIRNAMNYYYWH